MASRSWAKWGQEPRGERDIWFWWPPAVPVEADPAQLQAEQWVPLEMEQQTLSLSLKGQLANLVYIVSHSTHILETWVQRDDLHFAEKIPVVLAFYLPSSLIIEEYHDPYTLPPKVSTAEQFPPLQFGEIALVEDTKAGGWRPYSLHTLGTEGKAIWDQLHEQLITAHNLSEKDSQEVTPQGPKESDTSPRQSLEQHRSLYQQRYQNLHHLAQQLATLYWNAHQHALHQLSLRTLPETPHVIHTGVVIPAPQPVQAVLAAYSNAQSGAEGWGEINRLPTFVYAKDEGTTHVEFRPSDTDVQVDDTTIQSLWQQVRQLSDIDGDVLLAMLAQAIATPHDEKDGVWITGKLLLDYRGITPIMKRENGRLRRAGHRQEDLADVAACVSRMSNAWIRIEQWIEDDRNTASLKKGAKKKKSPYLYTRESRLINITDIIRQHELHQDAQMARPGTNIAVAWRYQIGSWVDPFLQGANRQVAWLLQQALSYDPYHQMWEKRLARYFTFHMRINATKGGVTITREIGQLIEELSLPINHRDPERTRQRFEKAMRCLKNDELISEWSYLKDNPPLPSRRWLEPWLKHQIWIAAATITEERTLLNAPHMDQP